MRADFDARLADLERRLGHRMRALLDDEHARSGASRCSCRARHRPARPPPAITTSNMVTRCMSGCVRPQCDAANGVSAGSGASVVDAGPLDQPAVRGDLQRDRLRVGGQRHGLARVGVDGVLAVLAVPLGDGRVLVHLLDDLPPADAGVVGAEGDLAHLRRVRDDAHLGAAEVVGPEILEPHAGDEQHQPLVGLAVAVVAARRAPPSCPPLCLSNFLSRSISRKPFGAPASAE